jgi:ATP-dependent Clp protease ATP-binding subunit ClpX
VTPELLSEFGMIPEFVGRLPIIQTLEPLDVDALERILTEPKNAVVRQMEALLRMDGATLTFEPGAVRAIAEQAYTLKTGARGARSILEKLLKQAQFEVPGTVGAVVTVKVDLSVSIDRSGLQMAA